MDSAIVAAIIGAIIGGVFGLCAAWIGFAASDRATRRRNDNTAALHAHKVRTMLRLEVERNLDAVADVLHALEYGLDGSELERQLQARLRLVAGSGPRWDRSMWERLAPDLPGVLDESVIANVYGLYADLAAVTRLRAIIAAKLPAGLVDNYREWRKSRPNELGTGSDRTLPPSSLVGVLAREYNGATVDDYTTCLNILNKWQSQRDLIPDTPLPVPPGGTRHFLTPRGVWRQVAGSER